MVTYTLYHRSEKCENISQGVDCDYRYLPSYYKDNYLLILPGETVETSVEACPHSGENYDHFDKSWYITVNGWNINDMRIPLNIVDS